MQWRRAATAALLASVLLGSLCAQDRQPVTSVQDDTERAVRAVLDSWRARGGMPCASCGFVAADGRAGAVAIGLADEATEAAMTPAHRLLSGSIGKTYVAAIALRLAARGELDLDARVADLLEGEDWVARLPNATALRVRHLLRHQTGIREHVWNPAFHAALRERVDHAWTPRELIEFALDSEPLGPAGSTFAYADTNYVLLGIVLEAVAGTTFEALLSREVLEPLQLRDTHPSRSRRLPGLANGYTSGRVILSRGPVLDDAGRYAVHPQFEWCGGGVFSTARDLARWGHALYATDAVLDSQGRAAMRDAIDAPPLGPGVRYGAACMLLDSPLGEAWGHTGVMPGFLSALFHYPDAGVTVAVQVNTDDGRRVGGRPRDLAHACARAVVGAR